MGNFSLSALIKLLALDFSPGMSICLERLICSSSLSLATLLALLRPIIFSVDGTPIREFKNLESIGVPFPKKEAMRIYLVYGMLMIGLQEGV
ncbi:hypothetical protein GH714_001733 [Hevea brasiliensis]|uniref:GH16 domain-containing protein n=1 Tax=Hevea brasiliensis TaxID=3981 RepID=A0A6A6M6T2_HEVBR|nr:hypothetical protein GH714_001733 [Hevea brasiliensis]